MREVNKFSKRLLFYNMLLKVASKFQVIEERLNKLEIDEYEKRVIISLLEDTIKIIVKSFQD